MNWVLFSIGVLVYLVIGGLLTGYNLVREVDNKSTNNLLPILWPVFLVYELVKILLFIVTCIPFIIFLFIYGICNFILSILNIFTKGNKRW
jgi:hypothetical protein